MIKYLGSKRRLVPTIVRIAQLTGARTALDPFTGTTRVAQGLKAAGIHVVASDVATYSHVLAQCYIAADGDCADHVELGRIVDMLNGLPGDAGYFTDVFCRSSRYLQPRNGERVDAIRTRILDEFAGTPEEPILLTALLEAADRVDSTVGLQMAYLKSWAPRSDADLRLRVPDLLPGPGRAARADVLEIMSDVARVDLAYLDPPYNQHRYYTNYHVWETLIRWDEPDHYGIACKRVDARDPATKSRFNRRREMPAALSAVLRRIPADVAVVSYNDESWMTSLEIEEVLAESYEDIVTLAFPSRRHVGAQIGIHDPTGRRVGRAGPTHNLEFLFVAGPKQRLRPVRSEFADPA